MTYIQAYQFFSDSSDLLLSSHKEFSNFSYCTFSIPEFLFFFNLFFMCTVSISLLIFSHWQDLVLMISFKFLNMVSVRVGSKFSPTLPLHSQQIPCAQYRTCWQAHKSYWMQRVQSTVSTTCSLNHEHVKLSQNCLAMRVSGISPTLCISNSRE